MRTDCRNVELRGARKLFADLILSYGIQSFGSIDGSFNAVDLVQKLYYFFLVPVFSAINWC